MTCASLFNLGFMKMNQIFTQNNDDKIKMQKSKTP